MIKRIIRNQPPKETDKFLAVLNNPKKYIKLDMSEILEKISKADVLVIATPTYFFTMNGMLKTVIDRFLPKWQDLGGHDVYLIITGHDGKKVWNL